MEWRAKLLKLRMAHRLSQAELAKIVGLHQSRIARWEKGDGEPSMAQGLRLAKALGTDYDFFADDVQDDLPAPALSPDEERVLWLVRAAGLSADDVAKALTGYAARREPHAGNGAGALPSLDPKTGNPLPRPGDRRRGAG